MKNIFIQKNIAVLVLLLVSSAPLSARADIPSGLVEEAARGLENRQNQIPARLLRLYGFTTRTEFMDATLGEPYQQIALNRAMARMDSSSEAEMLLDSNTWIFPVKINGQTRTLLFVKLIENEDGNPVWKSVGFGASLLANDIVTAENVLSQISVDETIPKRLMITHSPNITYLIAQTTTGDRAFVRVNVRSAVATVVDFDSFHEKIRMALYQVTEYCSISHAGDVYAIGQRVLYNGQIWESVISNNAWCPGDYRPGWKLISDSNVNPYICEEWSVTHSGDVYMTGDKVMFNGQAYQSLIDHNFWSPSTNSLGWQITSCP